MENDNIDKLFRDKIKQISDLPETVNWNSKKGWQEYQKLHFSKTLSVKRMFVYLSSAAAALAIVFLSISYYQKTFNKLISINNETTETMEITLPDGNTVWLNKNSSIEYPHKTNEVLNKISVSGEIYIEINNKKSQKYTIKAHNAVIIAETTASFNIRAYADEDNVDITVASGAVKIAEESFERGLALLVIQGGYCSVHKSQKLVYASENKNENYLAWKTGRLIFDNQPIASVKDILAEYYDTKIELEDNSIAYCLFTGSFEEQSINTILDQIQTDLNFEIKYTGNKIIFSGAGCM